VAYWLVVLLVAISSSKYSDGKRATYSFELITDFLYELPEIAAAYLLTYLIVPQFFYKKRYFTSILIFTVSSYTTCVAARIIIVKICEPLAGIAPKAFETYSEISTDMSGNFTFNNLPRGNYALEADLMGYLSVIKPELTINPTDTVLDVGLLQLNPSSKMLGEVTITARTPLIEKQIDKTVVNVDQNIANTGTSAFELLKKLPGVQVSPDGTITLNGKSGVNVIIDGKTTYLSADDLANLLTNTPSSDIQKDRDHDQSIGKI